MAGAVCPVEVMKRCVNEMNMTEVAIAYGMTETSPVSCQTLIDDDLERRTARSAAPIRMSRSRSSAPRPDVSSLAVSPASSARAATR